MGFKDFIKKAAKAVEDFQDRQEERDLKKLKRLKTKSKLEKQKAVLAEYKEKQRVSQSKKYDQI